MSGVCFIRGRGRTCGYGDLAGIRELGLELELASSAYACVHVHMGLGHRRIYAEFGVLFQVAGVIEGAWHLGPPACACVCVGAGCWPPRVVVPAARPQPHAACGMRRAAMRATAHPDAGHQQLILQGATCYYGLWPWFLVWFIARLRSGHCEWWQGSQKF